MLPEKVTRLINKTGETTHFEVEKGAIRRYADAVGDQNPLYWDEEYARRSRFGAIIAPPGFFGWPARWGEAGPLYSSLLEESTEAIAQAGFKRRFYGGVEYDFYQHVRAGDIIAGTPAVKEIREKEGRSGKMVFLVIETVYTNQNGEMVARASETFIRR